MAQNQELLRKADIALSDLSSNGGLLQDEQANTFIRKLLKTPTILNVARVVEMSGPSRQINKISFASRILKAGVQGTALTSGQRSSATTEQIMLNTQEVIAEVRVPYDVIEDNIERGNIGQDSDGGGGVPAASGFVDLMQTLIAERAALDLEELAIEGDTSSTDDFLALTDGYLETSRDGGNTVDNSGATVTKALFKKGVLTMPDQYLRNRAGMWHMVSVDQETEFRDTVADRATPLGDRKAEGFDPMYAYGTPVMPIMMMPTSEGLFTNPLNFIMGIQRRLHMEFDKDITTRTYIIVVTARVDFQVEEDDATVYYSNIGTPS